MSFKKASQKKDSTGCFFGLPDFDAIFQNSFKKGTVLTLEEDSPTKNYIAFIRYFVGCGFHSGEKSILFHDSYFKFSEMIPKKMTQPKTSQAKEETENKIAWRYDNFKEVSSNLSVNQNIPSLDLSRSEKLGENDEGKIMEFDLSAFSTLREFYEELLLQFQNSLNDHEDTSTKRIVIKDLISTPFFEKSSNTQKAQFFHSLKYFAKASHVFIVISVPSDISAEVRKFCINVSDVYIKLVSTLDKEAFGTYEGIMYILKWLKPPAGLCTIKPEANSWCIRNTKKSVSLVKLHIDPDIEEEKSNTLEKSSLLCFPNKTKKNNFEF